MPDSGRGATCAIKVQVDGVKVPKYLDCQREPDHDGPHEWTLTIRWDDVQVTT